MLTIQELFILSNNELKRVILQIKDEQWAIDMPPGMSRKPASLEVAVRYHTYDDAWVPDILAGRKAENVGNEFEYLKTEGNVRAQYIAFNTSACQAVQSFTDLDRQTHLSYGDYPAREYLQHIISFRAFRSYDIAKLIDVNTTMNPEFVDALVKEFTPVVEFYRQIGVFAPPIDVSESASNQTKLLAMVGRI